MKDHSREGLPKIAGVATKAYRGDAEDPLPARHPERHIMIPMPFALALLLQAPAPLEPLPPAQDPDVAAALGPVYADLVEARHKGEEAVRKLPVKLRPRVGPKLMATPLEEVKERWDFGASELEWVADLGAEGNWPATGGPAGATPEAKAQARSAYREAERRHNEEVGHYLAERDHKRALKGLPPLGTSMTSGQMDRTMSVAAANAGTSTETRCGATNRLGKPCTRMVPAGGFCWVHRDPRFMPGR
jgi:hypothetical protein